MYFMLLFCQMTIVILYNSVHYICVALLYFSKYFYMHHLIQSFYIIIFAKTLCDINQICYYYTDEESVQSNPNTWSGHPVSNWLTRLPGQKDCPFYKNSQNVKTLHLYSVSLCFHVGSYEVYLFFMSGQKYRLNTHKLDS